MNQNAERFSLGIQPQLKRSLVYFTIILMGVISGIYLGRPAESTELTLQSVFEKVYHLEDDITLTQNFQADEY
jgi:hypothetical protein